jgi:hypothetical protein
MCPLETGVGSTFNETYFTEFENAVKYITRKVGYVVLDAHNYMRTPPRFPKSMQDRSGQHDLIHRQATTIHPPNPPLAAS